MKKILVLDHATHLGGAERVLITLLKNIDKSLFDITVVVTGEGPFVDELYKNKIKYIVIPISNSVLEVKRGSKSTLTSKVRISFNFLKYVFKLKKYLNHEGFDCIYTNSMKAHMYGSVLAKITKKPLIWRLHDFVSDESFNKLTRKIFIFFAKKFPNRIITVSNSVKDSLLMFGVRKEKIDTVYNGISIRDICIDKSEYYTKYNIKEDNKIVGMLGWLIPWKGQDIFIKAANEVVKQNKKVHFIIVGGPLDDSKEYEQELKSMVRDYGLSEFITFTGNVNNPEDILSFMDISVHCSILPDPLPTIILESMMVNTPVIGVNLGGVPEIIEDNVSGRLFENKNYIELSNIILDLINNEDKCESFVKKYNEIISKKFSIEAYVNNHIIIYDEVIMKEGNV